MSMRLGFSRDPLCAGTISSVVMGVLVVPATYLQVFTAGIGCAFPTGQLQHICGVRQAWPEMQPAVHSWA